MTLPDPIPAATLVLMRPGPRAPEFLMVERAAGLAFAPGAMVFPGGRIDADDHLPGGDLIAAAKVAAIRETIEETGIAVGINPPPDDEAEAAIRAELHAGTSFSALVESRGLVLDLEALVPFARWCPNFRETRRFDAYFFLARAPADSRLPIADARESVHAAWLTASEALARADNGGAHIIFPTRRNLERLARFASFDEAAADARAHPVDAIVPWIEERNGTKWLCIPDDRGYPVTAERLETARRS